MRKRTWISLAVAAAVIAALILTVYLRKNAPPESARLLPEADAIVYINLKPLRALTRFEQHPVAHDAGYQAFIDATGIEFERDLDNAAFAVHRMADPAGPNGPLAYSEVFRGHFDGQRLTAYLAAQSAGRERYAGHDIYSIPHEGRQVRVVVLGYDLVAVSNTPTAEQIHSMIDRYHASASPFGGDSLLSRYYRRVPLLSEAWGIGHIGLPLASTERFRVFGLAVPLPADSTFIASIRYLGSLHVRVEEITASPQEAKQSAQIAQLAIAMLRSAQLTPGPQDGSAAEWNALLSSATVEQKDRTAIVKAVVPETLVRDLMATQKPDAGSAVTQPNPE